MLPEGGPGHQVELPSEALRTHRHTPHSLSLTHTQTHASKQPSIASVPLVRMIAKAIITRQQNERKASEATDKSEVEDRERGKEMEEI